MKYLSTFSGVGGFELAIHDVFEKAKCVGFSEIDKYAIQTYLKNFPHKDLNFGDISRLVYDEIKNRKIVNEYRINLLPNFDLLVSGFPCQDLSIANDKRKGLDGTKSGLFFACLEIIRIKKPKWFLFENVASMSKVNRDKISKHLGVEPVEICVDRFTPQKRKRLYWFNWVFDISKLPGKGERWPFLMAWSSSNDYHKNGDHKKRRERETRDGRANTLTTGKGCGSYSSKNYIEFGDQMGRGHKRILNPYECEELQGLPREYTANISNTQRYKQIGNSVNPDSVKAILLQNPDFKLGLE